MSPESFANLDRPAIPLRCTGLALAALIWLISSPALAQQSHDDTGVVLNEPYSENEAYDIQNPFAFIPRLLIENQLDLDAGPNEDVTRFAVRPRPLIPFRLGDDFALISRTTFNIVYQENGLSPDDSNEFGIGDTDVELYLSPRHAVGKTLIWGLGPILRLDTTTDEVLGTSKWGAGPTGALIWQPAGVDASSGWTFALLANHVWGYANNHASDLDVTYLQPILSYTFRTGMSLGVDTQSTYDWHINDWTVPLNATLSQLFEPWGQPIVMTFGGRYYVERPSNGPLWGGQINFNFLFD